MTIVRPASSSAAISRHANQKPKKSRRKLGEGPPRSQAKYLIPRKPLPVADGTYPQKYPRVGPAAHGSRGTSSDSIAVVAVRIRRGTRSATVRGTLGQGRESCPAGRSRAASRSMNRPAPPAGSPGQRRAVAASRGLNPRLGRPERRRYSCHRDAAAPWGLSLCISAGNAPIRESRTQRRPEVT